ncbi:MULTISPECIES: histidine phosphatase family protein [Clostridium]|uniref:histidine phosphatase family protein n=1 Tax=Clostridium TaxID=1485 RepID=UPI0003D353D0|nr:MULTISPECIES: histidine phosphatase family protein [Clostridium]ALB45407.1 histidine phosphatase family protein [Clostridium beijerinckii NRRL B-598]OVE64381.1 histidine phosphatase family protein [Clostridium diolis]
MGQTVLYLIRHGQTKWNLEKRMQGHKDSPLTEVGISQAQKLRDRLINEKIDLIYSSESKRAYDTAKIIQHNRNIPINIKKELKEIHMGKWEGMNQTDIINKYPETWENFWNNPSVYVPTDEGESYEELKARVIPSIEEIINLNQGKSIVIVTHRITLKVIMSHFMSQNICDICENPDIESASLSKIHVENGVPKILLYGDISHYK